jgi:hypothetical protein
MVFVCLDLFRAMNDLPARTLGYAFALPRLVARLAGRKVRRAEFSGWEAYGLGIVVFGISCVFAAHALLPLVRPLLLQLLALFLLPFAMWVAWLLVYYVDALFIGLCRKLGLYSAVTNNPFQHAIIMSLITLLATQLAYKETGWMQSLGILWLGLLALNLFSIACLKILDEG